MDARSIDIAIITETGWNENTNRRNTSNNTNNNLMRYITPQPLDDNSSPWHIHTNTNGKHNGVAIIIHSIWEERRNKTIKRTKDGRSISIEIALSRGLKATIIGHYAVAGPNSTPEKTKESKTSITQLRELQMAASNCHLQITAGDFNSTPEPRRDRSTTKHARIMNNTIKEQITYSNLTYGGTTKHKTSTFRHKHPQLEAYTYQSIMEPDSRLPTSSRIDDICMPNSCLEHVLASSIESFDEPTTCNTSDHRLMITTLKLGRVIQGIRKYRQTRYNQSKNRLITRAGTSPTDRMRAKTLEK